MTENSLAKVFGANAKLDNGVLTIDFLNDFGVTPTTPEQCLATLMWKLRTEFDQDSLDVDCSPSVQVHYQGHSSSTNFATNMQENFDRFEVTFRKVTPVTDFNPSDY